MIRTRKRIDAAAPPLARLLEQLVRQSGCQTLLDVGCGASSPVRHFAHRLARTVGMDASPDALAASRRAGIHHEYRQLQAHEIAAGFTAREFDCVIAVDLVEHLDKVEGLRLLERMERIARKRVVVFTANGSRPRPKNDNNPFQALRSAWSVEELRRRGYHVRGFNGWRPLRRWQPQSLWQPAADLSRLYCDRHPRHADQLLAVKDIEAWN